MSVPHGHPHAPYPPSSTGGGYGRARSYGAAPPAGGAHLASPPAPAHPPPPSQLSQPATATPGPPAVSPSVAGAGPPSTSNGGAPNGGNPPGRPLDVRDALTYLDQVKLQFANDPGVYNRFLDIMKDFKSHVIDTPGVIDRVSHLFIGHPQLIQGFNAFLPPGYYIHTDPDGADGHTVTVTTPSGKIIESRPMHPNQAPVSGYYMAPDQRGPAAIAPPPPVAPGAARPPQNHPAPAAAPPHGRPMPPPPGPPSNSVTNPPPVVHPPPPDTQSPGPAYHAPSSATDTPAGSYPAPSAATTAAAGNLTAQGPHQLNHHRAPLEFNHAINYVNKIKTRFTNQPEQYKRFLEILQNYQRDGQPIQEVYTEVESLFSQCPDLLDEFKQFLPDTQAPPPPSAAAAVPPGRSPASVAGNPRMPPVGDFGPSGPGREAYAGPPGEASVKATAEPLANRKKRSQPASTGSVPPGSGASAAVGNSKKRPRTQGGKHESVPPPELAPPAPATTAANGAPFTDEELELFAVVRTYLGHKTTYNEFLKLLNLYNEEIIDDATLVDRVAGFIGGNEGLFTQFKTLIGYRAPEPVVNHTPAPVPRIDLNTLRARGSYRKLPLSATRDRCSGRDDLCREVLNDTWVSHPTWSSEESTQECHKKNVAEETLHKCEEERYDFDLNIDSNLSVIAVLEPVARQLEALTPEERARFTPPADLLGDSPAVCRRMLKRVYGAERGLEVFSHLQTNPVVAVPVVLRRLKQKDEEWRKLRRQQNRVWRDMDIKSFFRSLDYQSQGLRMTERKHMTVKTYVTEIEKVRLDHLEGRSHAMSWLTTGRGTASNGDPQARRRLAHAYPPSYHLEYQFVDAELVRTTTRLLLNFHDKQVGGNPQDRARLEELCAFLENFLDAAPTAASPAVEAESDHPASEARENGTAEGTELKRSSRRLAAQNGNSGTLYAAGDGVDVSAANRPAPAQHTWIHTEHADSGLAPANDADPSVARFLVAPAAVNAHAAAPSPRWHTFYGNTNFYVFIRHFQVLYGRLLATKRAAAAADRSVLHDATAATPAAQLGLRYRPDLLSESDVLDGDYFEVFLNLADRMFEGEVETQAYEDAMRFLFRTHAHNVVGIHRILGLITKHAGLVGADPRCPELLALYDAKRSLPMTSVRQQILYRMQVESVVGSDEHIYRVEFLPAPSRACTVQLLLKDDFTLSHAVSAEDKWAYYVDSFVLLAPTEGVAFHGQCPFLRRNLPREAPADPTPPVVSHSGLEVKIHFNTYRICFVTHSEDFFMRTTRTTTAPRIARPAASAAHLAQILPTPAAQDESAMDTTEGETTMDIKSEPTVAGKPTGPFKAEADDGAEAKSEPPAQASPVPMERDDAGPLAEAEVSPAVANLADQNAARVAKWHAWVEEQRASA
ncbi:hypothetical protein IWQ60_000510 [Tieghemiomyces parasiticus]|uniref:Histone deacetylase interacting domain-containing protein n=1 Tax=Tieghemiomyces parasiticus TaxID=78921 RepID=A0A9W8AMJ5_9FUNG|nr:hypothetical protein IWQ60_000510 [Tieghemiomyces parasiticus]